MNDDGGPRSDLGKQTLERVLMSDVDVVVMVISTRLLQFLDPPACGGFRAEKVAAEVVVNPEDLEAFRSQEEDRLRADQAANSLLTRANSLVPGALGALRVILGDGARGRGRVAAKLGGVVGGVVLGLSLVLLGIAGDLLDKSLAICDSTREG